MGLNDMRMIGEITSYGYDFVPEGWAPCNGQIMDINRYQAVFAVLGVTYGGDGQRNFKLPNLRGRVPLQVNNDYKLGQAGGDETHTLTAGEMPKHTHRAFGATATASLPSPENNYWASGSGQVPFNSHANNLMANESVDYTGGGQPHTNMQPFLTVNYGICTDGIYPNPGGHGRDGYMGEITMFAGKWECDNWLFCDGRLLPISKYTGLFGVIGATYGGNGTTTFALPDLRGRAPLHAGKGNGLTNRVIGERGGVTTVTLDTKQIPSHTHKVMGTSAAATDADPSSGVWAFGGGTRGGVPFYSNGASTPTQMNEEAFNPIGGGAAHNNMQPYLGINFMICVEGDFPPRQ